jgi:hypothetical protein
MTPYRVPPRQEGVIGGAANFRLKLPSKSTRSTSGNNGVCRLHWCTEVLMRSATFNKPRRRAKSKVQKTKAGLQKFPVCKRPDAPPPPNAVASIPSGSALTQEGFRSAVSAPTPRGRFLFSRLIPRLQTRVPLPQMHASWAGESGTFFNLPIGSNKSWGQESNLASGSPTKGHSLSPSYWLRRKWSIQAVGEPKEGERCTFASAAL